MATMQRRQDLDALRGLMLVLMTITHFPGALSEPLGQPLGFVSSAEGFVVLSAFLVGRIATSLALRQSPARATRWLRLRALKVYAVHAGLLVLLFGALVPLARETGAQDLLNLAGYYRGQPGRAFAESLVLAYNPPLLDILPMYVAFLALTPALLALARKAGDAPALAASLVVWLASQFGAGPQLWSLLTAALDWKAPYAASGAFAWLAWQLLWVGGVLAGRVTAVRADAASPGAFERTLASRRVVQAAVVVALLFFTWRHAVGQLPFGTAHPELDAAFDKWRLGPLRLLDVAALIVLLRRWGPVLARERWLVVPLAALGSASLAVFATHLVACLLALALLPAGPRPLAVDVAGLALTFAAMALAAQATRAVNRRVVPAPRVAVSARTDR
ncbi:MAG: OpgC domain-containing protein [Proteobacteria bacterium]|nr:OpgC domain-containing protein [Pseudomonadota bacterium]